MELNIPLVCIKILMLVDLVILRSVSISTNHFITIYNEINFETEQANVSISKCSALPFSRVGSIKTHGNCARLYNAATCHGTFMEILPNSPFLYVLIAWDNFSDVKSAGPCPETCSNKISRFSPDGNVMVNIFEESYYEGTKHNILVKGCTRIDDDVINQTKSIKTNGYCIKLYCNDYCNDEEDQSIALGEGTALHKDLHYFWKFNVTKSISHCNYACTRDSRKSKFPRQGEIFFYEKSGFDGSLLVISNINSNCNDIRNDTAGFINSIQISHNTCVFLFEQNGCVGPKYILNMSLSDLSEWRQNQSIKSIQECLEYSIMINPIMPISPTLQRNVTKSEKMWPRIHEYTELSLVQIIVIALLGIVGVLGFVFIAVFISRKRHAHSKKTGGISEREIRQFLNGYDDDNSNRFDKNFDTQSTEFLAQNRPYNKKYEVSMSRIEYDLEKPLQKEDLGVFYKGVLKPITEESKISIECTGKPVTIKTANPSSGLHCLQSILKEVKVMLYLGKHANIAHLVGCCTENLNQGKIFVLMECCAGGTLHSYLQNNRQTFINLVTKGRLSIDGEIKSRVQSIHLPNMTENLREQSSFDTFLIVQWCIDVSSGLEFLSNAKIVHSDLAAKNILLTDKLQAKISDYGLSRQIYSRARYMKTQHEPWRWMAPESVKRLEFSIKSDIWSYGVLSWEIFTLGEKPYHGIRLKEQFLCNIEEGLRLTKPRNATNEFYTLMLRCWEDEPTDRPSFTEISNQIQEMLEELINLIN